MKRSILRGSAAVCVLTALFVMLGLHHSLAQVLPQATPLPPPIPNDLAVFYSGQRWATLEPCGCHTRMQGGIQLEASAYKPYAAQPQLRLDAGEWASLIGVRNPTEPLKTAYLLRGLTMLDFDAVNVAVSDVQMSGTWFNEVKQSHPESLTRLVSCNVFSKDSTGTLAFQDARYVTRKFPNGKTLKVGITGVANLSSLSEFKTPGQPAALTAALASSAPQEVRTTSFIITDPQAALAAELKKMSTQCDMSVVLYSGDIGMAIDLAKANQQIDLLVTTARNPDPAVKFIRQGRTIILLNPMPQAKVIALVNLKQDAGTWQTDGEAVNLVISRELPADPHVNGLIEEYKNSTHSLPAELPPAGVPETFAGEDKCVNCHTQQHAQWSGTPHAHAMQTLIEHNQQYNPDCVRCHVTGYKHDNGFWHITDPHSEYSMTNVQCEVCHGPAQQHASDEQTKAGGAENWMKPPELAQLKQRLVAFLPKKSVAASICTQCHTAVTDPDFNFDRMIVQVNHSQKYVPAPGKDMTKMHAMPKTAAATATFVHPGA